MYNLTQDVVKGMNIVTALQNHPNMPGINDVFKELDYFVECVMDSEQFYGVPFRVRVNPDERKAEANKEPHFDVISDVKAHLREFYFGASQETTFGYRPRALFCLVIEPLLDSMVDLGHDVILDCTANVIEQLKEHALIAEHGSKLDPNVAYKLYRQITSDRQKDKKTKEIVAGVMKLRKKTIAIQREIDRLGKS